MLKELHSSDPHVPPPRAHQHPQRSCGFALAVSSVHNHQPFWPMVFSLFNRSCHGIALTEDEERGRFFNRPSSVVFGPPISLPADKTQTCAQAAAPGGRF